jgi:hypothetical protein
MARRIGRFPQLAGPEFRRVVEAALEYERQLEREQAEWLAKQR